LQCQNFQNYGQIILKSEETIVVPIVFNVFSVADSLSRTRYSVVYYSSFVRL
jgi:hypothetical protein